MIEEKMFYIAPEVEIICFAPMENVAADDLWSAYSLNGSGEVTASDVGDGEFEGGGSGGEDGDVDEGEA